MFKTKLFIIVIMLLLSLTSISQPPSISHLLIKKYLQNNENRN